MGLGLNKTEVKLVEFSSEWKKSYNAEALILQNILSQYEIKIEHIGSTAIPNMTAKPIIDILLGVKSQTGIDLVKSILIQNKYIVSPLFLGLDEFLFGKSLVNETSIRTHYIHLVIYNDHKWLSYVRFRDYLIKYPNIAKQYIKLKESLLSEFSSNRIEYTKNKAVFIKKICDKAFKELKK